MHSLWKCEEMISQPLSFRKKIIEDFEYIRLSLAMKFIDNGYASPTDYLHVIKLHLINNKKIKIPDQFINLSKTKAYKYKTKNVNSTVDDILSLFLKFRTIIQTFEHNVSIQMIHNVSAKIQDFGFR